MELELELDQAIMNRHVSGVYAIFREAETLAYQSESARSTRDRANRAYSVLVGYPIDWPSGSSFYYGRLSA